MSLSHSTLASLPLANQLGWIAARRARLHLKQNRERAYLNRRAARGVRTSTDEMYEGDVLLETDLLEALDVLAARLRERIISPSRVDSSTLMQIGEEVVLTLDSQYREKGRPRIDLEYDPSRPEPSIQLVASVPWGMYTSLRLTSQEALILVKKLRQIPAIEQATDPKACIACSPDLSDLVFQSQTGPNLTNLEPAEVLSNLSDLALYTGCQPDATTQQP